MTFQADQIEEFRYLDFHFDAAVGVLRCHYALDDLRFEERITFDPPADGVDAATYLPALRLVHLLAGISYYKAAAPPTVVVDGGLTPAERRLLESFYRLGLGEYAYRNELSLAGVRIVADERAALPSPPAPTFRRPLIPFGGGLDSIVTVEGIRDRCDDAALFVVSREGDHFDAIEGAAAVTGLPVARAERRIDDQILRSAALGFRNGHVPVTGIISAIAVAAALLDGRDAVVMSNEWSASSGNVAHDGIVVNHQWSKTLEFEDLFRAALAEVLPAPVDYFSWLRPFSELWVADRFPALGRYHQVFRSCNRAFHIDPALRLDHWCGHCDKCCFIDLILSPFLDRAQLDAVFDGNEPLASAELAPKFRTLAGLSGDIKPFECVGDVDECRVALLLAAERPDRAGDTVLAGLAAEVRAVVPGDPHVHAAVLLRPMGEHRIPRACAPDDLLG